MKQATPLFLYLVEQSLKMTVFIPFQSVTTPKPQLSQLPIRQKKENVTIIKKEIKVKKKQSARSEGDVRENVAIGYSSAYQLDSMMPCVCSVSTL